MRVRLALAAILAASAFESIPTQAADLFQMFWRATEYKQATDGGMTVSGITEQYFVRQVARQAGLNPRDLIFVYRPSQRDAAVVRRANGAFVASIFQMNIEYTDVPSNGGRNTIRHALLYDEDHQVALGSFFGLEHRWSNTRGGLSNYSLSGTVVYSKQDQGMVYRGTVWTGRRIADTTGS